MNHAVTAGVHMLSLLWNSLYFTVWPCFIWKYYTVPKQESKADAGVQSECRSEPSCHLCLLLDDKCAVWMQWQCKLVPLCNSMDPAAVGKMSSDKSEPLRWIGWLALFLLCFMWIRWNSKICGWFGVLRSAPNRSPLHLPNRGFLLFDSCQSKLFKSNEL